MRLAEFIEKNALEITGEWETFAGTLQPAAGTMSSSELRDHAKNILDAIVLDLKTYQSASDQAKKSMGLDPAGRGGQWAATIHGKLRHQAGFNLRQLAAEYRALRASVIKLWNQAGAGETAEKVLEDMTRFNEAIDEALADSIATFSNELARSRNAFVGMLGHDLRTPLHAISVSAHYLSMPNMSDQERLPAALRITRSVKAMDGMIKDLLEFAKATLGTGIPITAEDNNVGVLCQAAAEDIRTIYPNCKVQLEMSGDLNGKFDGARIQQVLWNLLTNAVKYSARNIPITLSASTELDDIKVAVHNRGSLIPEHLLEAIFDPLIQGPGEHELVPAQATSIGLGLYIARQIMSAHGGSLNVASSQSEGTTFTAMLPRTPPKP